MENRYRPLFLLLLFVVFAPACISTMKVKVDIIDRKKLMTAPEVLLMDVLAISEVEQARLNSQFYEEQRDNILAAFDKVLEGLVKAKKLGLDRKKDLLNDLKLDMEELYFQQVAPELNDAILTTKSFFSELPSKTTSLTEQQLNKVYSAKGKFNNVSRLLNDYLINLSKLQADGVQEIKPFLENDSDFSLSSYREILNPTLRAALHDNKHTNALDILHKGLYDDPLNSFITQAPREYWRKMYNKTVAKNLLGDTDIAVVMETPGNFFIKGVRMDAENVTKHLANTFNTSVRFLGKVNGLNLGTSKMGQTTPQEKKSNALAEEVSARTKADEAAIQEKVSKLSIINLMDAIIAQKDSLSSNSGYADALEQIQSIYEIHKTQLEPTQKQ